MGQLAFSCTSKARVCKEGGSSRCCILNRYSLLVGFSLRWREGRQFGCGRKRNIVVANIWALYALGSTAEDGMLMVEIQHSSG